MTLNQLKTRLKQLSTNHKILKGSFYFEYFSRPDKMGESDIVFPCLMSSVEGSSLGSGYEMYRIKLYAMTLTQEGNDEMNDHALSDMNQVLNDAIVWLRKFFPVSEVVEKVPFYQIDKDLRTGWEATLTIKTMFDTTSCDLPINI